MRISRERERGFGCGEMGVGFIRAEKEIGVGGEGGTEEYLSGTWIFKSGSVDLLFGW